MPERGKCQACGVYATLDAVSLSVRGRKVFEGDLCRRCACAAEDGLQRFVRETQAIWTSARRLADARL